MLKRSFDVGVSALVLLVLSPLLLTLAFAVALTSPGPVFYRATRVGRYGKPFKMYKFRTMVVHADRSGLAITAAGDKRVTRIGRWLRRTKLDELPEFINVLFGDMSLVGPRPEDPHYVALYTEEQRRVLQVRPGITSVASVRYRNEEDLLDSDDPETQYITEIMPAKLKLDLEYIDSANLWLDLTILWQTFFALL